MPKSMTLTYTVTVDPDIPEDKKKFEKFVLKTLNDKRGIPRLYGHKLKFKQVPIGERANIRLHLSSNEKVGKICGFDLLSCADISNNHIYINWARWNEGSETFRNGLPKNKKKNWLEQYRQYIVIHEFSHLLGMRHPPKTLRFKSTETASPMIQQTVDLQGGISCPWPKMSDKKYFENYVILNIH